MITTDTIITDELLAELDKCPFCGMDHWYVSPKRRCFKCGSSAILGKAFIPNTERCEIVWLRARVAYLKSKLQRLAEAGDDIVYEDSIYKRRNEWTQAKEAK